jgi:hypothetical protein
MLDELEEPVPFDRGLDFGAVGVTTGEKAFCLELSDEIVALCRSLPASAGADALLFLMKYLKTTFGRPLNFFENYYAPAWSTVYWLIQSASEGCRLTRADRRNAKTAHSMALFLHPLDDHLNDHQLPATHLNLLLRSQAWMLMHNALVRLADGIEESEAIVKRGIEDYYAGIIRPQKNLSLDGYCDCFRAQMATWLIVPGLIAKKMAVGENLRGAILAAYGSFGIAWRLLDDIQDIKVDMIRGRHSAVYTLLPDNIRHHWDKIADDKDRRTTTIILEYIFEHNAVERITARICSELESAASLAAAHGITHLSDQFRCLMRPLANR